jgi:hypothetical protein
MGSLNVVTLIRIALSGKSAFFISLFVHAPVE